MFGLFGVPVDAAYYLVTTLSAVLTPVAGGLAVGVAIAAFTVAVRLLVLPFSYYAMRGQAAQARIAPQVQALRQRYAKQPDRLSASSKRCTRKTARACSPAACRSCSSGRSYP